MNILKHWLDRLHKKVFPKSEFERTSLDDMTADEFLDYIQEKVGRRVNIPGYVRLTAQLPFIGIKLRELYNDRGEETADQYRNRVFAAMQNAGWVRYEDKVPTVGELAALQEASEDRFKELLLADVEERFGPTPSNLKPVGKPGW